jgi:2-polyprenyl-3-methyl-5-hydroxy-6-metoxy-1,4-benzoquinol methylase
MDTSLSDATALTAIQSQLPPEINETTVPFNWYRFIRVLHWVQQYISLPPEQTAVLDIGCGIGTLALLFHHHHYRIECLDAPNTGIRPWLERNKIPLHQANIEIDRLNFDDETFHLVTCLDVIEHLHGSPKNMLQEIHRILKPGGVLILGTPNAVQLYNRLSVLLGKSNYTNLDYFFNASYPYTAHVREYTRPEVKTILKWAGFQPIKIPMLNTFLDATPVSIINKDNHPQYQVQQKYQLGFKLNSLRQFGLLLYFLATFSVPNWRQNIIAIARRPT